MAKKTPTPAPAKKPQAKCSKKNWCSTMQLVLDGIDTDSRPKGFDTFEIWNLKTMTLIFVGVLYRRKGGSGDKGVILRYCPWCKAELLPAKYRKKPVKA